MADDPHNTSDISDPVAGESPREDAETKAAREELKQTAISDKADEAQPKDSLNPTSTENAVKKTPELEILDSTPESLEVQVSSPRKKRDREAVKKEDEESAEDDAPNGQAVASRTDLEEPEKKRQRDKINNATSEKDASFSVCPSPPSFTRHGSLAHINITDKADRRRGFRGHCHNRHQRDDFWRIVKD